MLDHFKGSENVANESREMKPISAKERLPVIDVLRGTAILCILFLNMQPYSFPETLPHLYVKMFNGMADQIVFGLTQFFGQGKFYSMLSFLFGLGMAVQVTRTHDTGKKFSLLYSRRLLVLLGIGLFHDLALWGGIILLMYSTMGFFLLFFKKRQPKTLLTWAVILLLIPVLIHAVLRPAGTHPAMGNQQQTAELEMKKVHEAIDVYRDGSYWDMFLIRLDKLKTTALITARGGWGILGLFLLGIWVWQKGIFQDIEKNLKFLRKTRWVTLALGLGGTLIFFLLDTFLKPPQPLSVRLIGGIARTVGTSALSFFYIATIVLLMRKESWKRFLRPLEAVGRMALSNYFLQSLICTTLFYSYGFNLFGKIGPLTGFLLVFPISAVQIFLSARWAKHFRFGPVEWLWHSLTYGKRQTMA
ncbi:MAG: DUF418 domain-containing protein [Candidatus Aminicenantes bacterium]|nr:DUF418 domain-containing protein [Candidatus Aminicenantes bacterium]